jgi:hypothetical protein
MHVTKFVFVVLNVTWGGGGRSRIKLARRKCHFHQSFQSFENLSQNPRRWKKNKFIFQIVRQRNAAKINLSIIQNVDVYVTCKYDNFAHFIVKYVTVTGR